MQVVKRDGRVMEFNKQRIVDAIIKAMMQTKEGIDEEMAIKIASSIEKQLENRDDVSVYEIQSLVEKRLMVSSRKEVATEYITYRYTRDMARKSKTKNIFLDIITSKTNTLLDNKDMYQNIGDMMDNFAAESIRPYVDTILLSKDVREAEKSGYIEILNKSYYPTKAIMSFQIPLSLDSEFLKDCKNVEEAIISILSIIKKVDREVCNKIVIPPIKKVLNAFEKKTFDEEMQNITDVFEDIDEDKTYFCKLLAEKQSKSRVNNSLKFLFEGISTLHKSVIFLENEDDYSCGRGVVNAVRLNLPNIAFEAFNYTKDTNIRHEPNLETNENEIIKYNFLSSLRKYIDISIKAIIERFNFQATGTKRQFPTLMSGLWVGSERLNDDDTLEGVLRNGIFDLEIFGIDKAISILDINQQKNTSKTQKIRNEIISEINEMLMSFSKDYELEFRLRKTEENQDFGGEKNENS